MADHAAELAPRHRQPEIFKHGRRTAARARITFCNSLDGDEFVRGHARWPPATGAPLLPACGAETSKARSEKVGMRGSLRENGDSETRGESPSPDRFAIDLSPQAGRGEKTTSRPPSDSHHPPAPPSLACRPAYPA